jgi:adenine-specific DNA-methyltransferase
MSKRPAARTPAAWLARLAGSDDDLDFGIYRRLRELRGELERLLTVELPGALEQSLAPADRMLVLASFDRLVTHWQGQMIDCCPARRAAAEAIAAGFHLHATSPLPYYAFLLRSGRRVAFRLSKTAPPTRDDDPADQRFVLSPRQPVSANAKELTITLEQMPQAGRRKQSVINAELCATIAATTVANRWRDELLAPYAGAKGGRSHLHFHLDRFTSWSEDDLLLPRNLQPRLHASLEAIMTDLWSPAAIEALDAAGLEVRRSQASLLRDFGLRIINWLQTRADAWLGLWRQTPRIARTDYLCTLDRVPAALRSQVLDNDAQWSRWQDWFGLSAGARAERSELLESHSYLVVDAALYPPAFAAELLAAQPDARQPDGVLVHGENSAALRLLAGRYAGRVALCAIDPPYNTGIGVWSFADTRAHEAWVRMMEDRLELTKELLSEQGALFVMLDDHEQARLRQLLDRVFGEENFLATIVWEKVHTRKNSARHFSVSHDYIHGFARDKRRWQRQLLPRVANDAYTNHDDDPRGPWKPDPVYANKPYQANYQIAKPNGVLLDPPPGRYWRYSERSLLEKAARQEVMWGAGDAYPLVKRYLADAQPGLVPVTLFSREFAGDNAEANAELRALFGRSALVSYPKPSRLYYRLAQIATTADADQVVLDFFAGSGSAAQAVLALNRADGGHRRFVLVEKGPCFDTVLLPRVAKCLFSDTWKNGHPIGTGTSQFVEVLRLESLEDALCRDE